MSADRVLQAFKKMKAGTVGGQSRIATPPNTATRKVVSNATTPRPPS